MADRIDAMMVGLALMWGTAFAALKQLTGDLDPFQMTWFRYVPFLLLYGLWLPFGRRARFTGIAGRDWPLFALAGALGVIGYHVPLNSGITGPGAITAATAAILVATTPLWTLLFAVLIGQEDFSGAKAVGSVTAFAGVAVIVLLAPSDGAELRVSAKAAIVLVAPICWGLYSIVAKPLITRHGGLFTTGLTFCIGTLMLVPIGIRYGTAPLAALSGMQWVWLAFISLGATVLGYTVWNHALRRRTATEVTTYIYLVPVVAAVAGWLVLDEGVTLWFALGAALVLAGVVQVNRARARPAPAPEAVPGRG